MKEGVKMLPLFAAVALGACNPVHEPVPGSGMPTESACSERGLSTEEYADQVIVTAEQAVRSGGGTADIGPLLLGCSHDAIERAWNKVNERPESDEQWAILGVIDRGEERRDEIQEEFKDSI